MLPRPRPPIITPPADLQLAAGLFSMDQIEHIRAKQWWRGLNPFTGTGIRPGGTSWKTLGCAYNWTIYKPVFQDYECYKKRYDLWANELAAAQARVADWQPILKDEWAAILRLAGSETHAFLGQLYDRVPEVATSQASTAYEHACPHCFGLLARPELARPGMAPYWICECHGDEKLATVREFVWRDI